MNWFTNLFSILTPLTAIVLAVRTVLTEAVRALRELADKTADESLRAQYLEAAARFQQVLDSTELAAIGAQAAAEAQAVLTTGRSPIRHDPTDLQ